MIELKIYLISENNCDTLLSISHFITAQLFNVKYATFVWPLLKTHDQIDEIINNIKNHNDSSVILFTISSNDLKQYLENESEKLNILCISPLESTISKITDHFNFELKSTSAFKLKMKKKYHNKIEAMNYMLEHDDGQSSWDTYNAHIIIIGVSRTSKSPTSMYLAYKGYKVANIPYVSGLTSIVDNIDDKPNKLVVGLTIDYNRMVAIRKKRLKSINNTDNIVYADEEKILSELTEAETLFKRKKWPVIDVTYLSVEEISSEIIKLLNMRHNNS